MKKLSRALLWVGLAAAGATAHAERAAVLPQIDLPHPYYYREMFLPQLTSGPSSLAWSPDSAELVYSAAGSLWRQKIGADSAQQLTAAAAYDYQPDWSPDGRWVIYSSYRGDAVELWLLDLADGSSHALTNNGAVNVEPRFSPDGTRVVFTSTLYNKRFHIFTADLSGGSLSNIRRVTGEHKSGLPRYYYSAFDTEINPVWTRDGHDLIYVSNRGHIYGTGGFWRAPAAPNAEAREIHYEETNWKARPDVSPDGARIVYSSYLGRSFNNLWLMPSAGGDAFPIAYGDWDMTYPRWSPDAKQIAFISNRNGGTEICRMNIPGGLISCLPAAARHHLAAMGQLHLVLEAAAHPAAARISVTDAAGMFHAPHDAWIHADDGFDRKLRRFEQHYFHLSGEATIDVPAGEATVKIVHGMERKIEERRVAIAAGTTSDITVNLDENSWSVPDGGRDAANGAGAGAAHWVSADVHIHMNYGGNYRNTPAHLEQQAYAENLGIAHDLIVNKEQRFPDIAYAGRQVDGVSDAATPTSDPPPSGIVVHGQEYHTSYWGHLGLLDIAGGIILPGYVGYPNTAAASLYPMNADVADIAHARGALVGYVHPFDEIPEPVSKPHEMLTNELPVDMALGKVDYMEILGFCDFKSTAAVWYRLLNLGFRLPAAGGTDAMANYASLRGPVGMNRVYVRVPERESRAGAAVKTQDWLDALKAGRSFATNGPLLGLHIGGAGIGGELKFDRPQPHVAFAAHLRSIVAVDHLDLVCNGRVIKSFSTRTPVDHGDFEGTLPLNSTGWCLFRAFTDGAREQVLDNYVYATTSPIYVTVAGRPPHSPEDARYFAAWTDRLAEAAGSYPDWNDAAEKSGVLDKIARAKALFESMEK